MAEPVPFPFVHPRRIGFGDCDPARIFFAPRAFDFAVEAVEACFRDALGAPWEALVAAGTAPRFRTLSCVFRRSARASEVLRLCVAARAVDNGAVALAVDALTGAGESCFEVGLELGLAGAFGATVPFPASLRTGLEGLRRGAPAPRGPPADDPAPGPALFHRPRRLRHGECGPDGFAYPPRLLDLAVEAAGEWYETVVGLTWVGQCLERLGTPFVSIRADLLRPLRAGDEVMVSVRAPRLGRASIDYEVLLRGPDGALALSARMAACHITEASGTPVPRPFPDDLRARIEAHQRACAAAAPTAAAE